MDTTIVAIQACTRGRRTGFTFIEILFAVMILGIGFIMIAGIFPVAISQTATTQADTIGAAVSAHGTNSVISIGAGLSSIPPTGQVIRFQDAAWDAIKGNQIFPGDRRFAWIPLLKRDPPDSLGLPPTTVQLIIIPVQVRGRTEFTARDLIQLGPAASTTGNRAHGTLMPLPIRARLQEGGNNPDTVTFTRHPDDPTANVNAAASYLNAAAPGAVLVLAGATIKDARGRPVAGRAYRLGNRLSTTANNTNLQFELLRGSDLVVEPGQNGVFNPTGPNGLPGGDDISQEPRSPTTPTALVDTDAFIVGQGYVDPTAAPGALRFGNGNMALGVYMTYIPAAN